MAENPDTWGPAEKVIHAAMQKAHDARAQGVAGLTTVRQIADALRDAGLLHEHEPRMVPAVVLESLAALWEERADGSSGIVKHDVLTGCARKLREIAEQTGPIPEPHPGGGAHVCSCGRRVQ